MFNFRRITKSRKKEEDIVGYIEQEAGCSIPGPARERILKELEVSIRVNGEVSQAYIDNLIRAYKIFAAKNETADLAGNAVSKAS